MSDTWIRLIPEEPNFVPDPARQSRAREHLADIAPFAEQIEVRIFDRVVFFDCGANFERVICPSCRAKIPLQWWQDRMNEDYDSGFTLAAYPTPCCSAHHTLHELVYEQPRGLAILQSMR
jgi:hypothetical protein